MAEWAPGTEIIFHPAKGSPRPGTIPFPSGPVAKEQGLVWVQLDGDPFPVKVEKGQVAKTRKNRVSSGDVQKEDTMSTKTKTKGEAKALLIEAKNLGVRNPESLGLDELRKAVKRAKRKSAEANEDRPRTKAAKSKSKSKSKSAKSASKSTAKAKPKAAASKPKSTAKATAKSSGGGTNPFRKGSDLHVITPLLLRGGKRRTIAEKLQEKISLHPYSAKSEEEVDLKDFDKRVLLAAGTLRRRFGYEEVRKGRGLDGTIKVVPPASSNGSAKKGKSSKS